MDLGIWSMPGIEVTDISGRVIVFQNVVKRDDAFRKLGMSVKSFELEPAHLVVSYADVFTNIPDFVPCHSCHVRQEVEPRQLAVSLMTCLDLVTKERGNKPQ